MCACNGEGDIVCGHLCGFSFAYALPEKTETTSRYFTRSNPPLLSAFPTKQQAFSFLCDTLFAAAPPPPSFIKAHSDLHQPPSAASLIKDTDIITKFGTSTCHHCAQSVCIMFDFVSLLRRRTLHVCFVLITTPTFTQVFSV